MDRYAQYMVSAEAINDAAFLKNLDKDRAGVIWDQVVA
jgi:hypothetical protein